MACGRLRMIENGQEMQWGPLFDRPTPELYHVEAGQFISRPTLTGGLFTEAFERDGRFCWALPSGSYFLSRIVPWQGNVTKADDLRKNIFPGVTFTVPGGVGAVYLGTLVISMPVSKDFMGNKWISGHPSVRVLDEFDREMQAGDSGRVEKQLMVARPELEGVPLHPGSTLRAPLESPR